MTKKEMLRYVLFNKELEHEQYIHSVEELKEEEILINDRITEIESNIKDIEDEIAETLQELKELNKEGE